jgi:hypothetical protein
MFRLQTRQYNITKIYHKIIIVFQISIAQETNCAVRMAIVVQQLDNVFVRIHIMEKHANVTSDISNYLVMKNILTYFFQHLRESMSLEL